MKHCAKKLLGLAFALALCLAVGGTALAQTPESADLPAALPEQEMLDYEPNVTTAADEKTIDKFATDGYTVTIPTTVEVKSEDNKGKLEVNAKLKQYRTLNITIKPQDNKWTLKYQDAAGADTPEVTYQLPQKEGNKVETDCEWQYKPGEKKLSFSTTKMQPTASLEEDMKRVGSSSYELPITVPQPEQATMSGTYSDTLAFTFSVEKELVTYTINAYGQKLALTTDTFDKGAVPATKRYIAINAVDVVNEGVAESGAELVSTVTVEYPSGGEEYTWKRLRPTDNKDEDTRCWEDLTCTLNPTNDFPAGETTKTINLNLVRKWCWLDVNGVTEGDTSGDPKTIGTQGTECIAGYVDICVSADGATWSDWYWYRYGDDYWGTFPYGTEFKLGLHHVKDGYVYDEDATGKVAIYANGDPTSTTTTSDKDENTTYRVYQGKLEGAPVDTALHTTEWGGYYHDGAVGKSLPRYCYNPCYKKGITYYANGGSGGTEDTYRDFKPHSNVPYDETGTLKNPEDLKITPPAGKSFAGWSVKDTYTKGDPLYKADDKVSNVTWGDAYTGEEFLKRRPEFGGQKDAGNRTLYAIWGYDIKVEFEDATGYSTNDGMGPVATLGGTMEDKYSFTVKGQLVEDGKGWTLDLTDPTVKKKIDEATTQAKSDAGDNRATTTSDDVWKTDIEYKLSAAEVKSGKPLVIKRRRYLLSVISTNIAGVDDVVGIATNAGVPKFGTFNVTINDGKTDLGVTGKSHCQVGLNYGAKYTVDTMTGIDSYQAMDAVILKSLKVGDEITKLFSNDAMKTRINSYTSHMTGKETNIHYYTGTGALDDKVYTGDPVRVAFMNFTSATKPGSTTPKPGPSHAPAKKALTLRYHANFDPTEEVALDLDPAPLLDDMDDTFGFDPDPLPEDGDDALEEAVKTVTYQPGENVVLRNCMFKRGGYVFVGWNTEPDGTGKLYRVNGVPITDWAAGDTVDLYAQWKKPEHLKPVVDNEPQPEKPDAAAPAAPPERVDDGFDADFGADPAAQPDALDDAFGVDPAPQPEDADAAFGVDPDPQPEELDDAFGVDPDPQSEELDAAFGADPDPLPDELDDAFSV